MWWAAIYWDHHHACSARSQRCSRRFERDAVQEYFEEEHYNALEVALLEYGKEKLGCVGISPIWLSYYVGESPRIQAPPVQSLPWL